MSVSEIVKAANAEGWTFIHRAYPSGRHLVTLEKCNPSLRPGDPDGDHVYIAYAESEVSAARKAVQIMKQEEQRLKELRGK